MDKRNYIAVALLAASASLLFWRYGAVLQRLLASGRDFVCSVAYWAIELFEWNMHVEPTVVGSSWMNVSELPFDPEEISERFLNFGLHLYDWELFAAYNNRVLNALYQISLFGSVLLPALVMLAIVIWQILFSKGEKAVGYRSKPLRAVLATERKTVHPVLKALKGFFSFFWKKDIYRRTFLLLWLINTNAVTIALEALAYYYYALISFGLVDFLQQLGKLFVDVLIGWYSLPVPVWAVLFYLAFDYSRKKKGYDVLAHQEAKNCGFLKSTGYISIVVGAPGVGKTAFVTDAALSWVNIHKEESKELIADDLLTFPEFPFLLFQKDIRNGIAENRIFNVPSAEQFAKDKWERFQKNRDKNELYGYEYSRFGLEKDLGNRMETLENTMREHAKAYFIYLCENTSLSNYPIRFDGGLDASKYFPLWKSDFFQSKPQDIEKKSVYAHILDQDLMRMGKTVQEFNPKAGTFGFGIYTNTEWAKSRGNSQTLQGVSKDAEEANQKNDLYEYAHKMCRHASTMVRGKVFFRFIGDEQRPRSLGVDLRDLSSVLSIESKSELQLAMPHFVIGEMLYHWLYQPMLKAYFRWINLRGDETLFSYFCLKKPLSWLSVYYRRIYNIFGTYELGIKKEAGTSYGDTPEQTEAEHHIYYLMPKKIYADRYNSDCYEGFFAKKQLDCGKGINDLPTYAGLGMTLDEMNQQNDYFLLQLMQVFAGENGQKAQETIAAEPEDEEKFTFLEI